MLKLFDKYKYLPFAFSLVCGVGYFLIAYYFIDMFTHANGGFLAFLFCPAIVCGTALFVLKILKKDIEEQDSRRVNILVIMHIIILALGVCLNLAK